MKSYYYIKEIFNHELLIMTTTNFHTQIKIK